MNKIFMVLAAGLLAACAGKGAGTDETPDGDKINLSASPRGLIEAKTDHGTLTGYNQNYSFYGLWKDDLSELIQVRYQGKKAVDIPQSGRAVYHGKAVRWDSINDGLLADGTSQLNVDFGNKTVDGKITMPGLRRDITLHQGNLRGGEYAGQASVLGNNGGRYSGELFGPQARETAGIVEFKNNTDLNTSFGGVRYK